MLFLLIEAHINNYDFTYKQILNILFIGNKIFSRASIFFFNWDTISPMEPHVIPNNLPQSGDEMYNLYKSFKLQSDPIHLYVELFTWSQTFMENL